MCMFLVGNGENVFSRKSKGYIVLRVSMIPHYPHFMVLKTVPRGPGHNNGLPNRKIPSGPQVDP